MCGSQFHIGGRQELESSQVPFPSPVLRAYVGQLDLRSQRLHNLPKQCQHLETSPPPSLSTNHCTWVQANADVNDVSLSVEDSMDSWRRPLRLLQIHRPEFDDHYVWRVSQLPPLHLYLAALPWCSGSNPEPHAQWVSALPLRYFCGHSCLFSCYFIVAIDIIAVLRWGSCSVAQAGLEHVDLHVFHLSLLRPSFSLPFIFFILSFFNVTFKQNCKITLKIF